MAPRNSFSYKLTAEQQAVITDILKHGNYRPMTVPYAKIAGETPDCKITLYNSGKLLLQGKGAADLVSFVIEPLVLQTAGLGYEDVLNPEALQPRMGVDESGKGDFFGPLVIVGAYADESLVSEMREMDVKDSKNISSDGKALDMGRALRKLLGKRYALVKIGPAAYNRLYAKMRNVNTILAWAHARAIENLLEAVPSCPLAISDQFGSRDQVKRALMSKGRKIELIQKHRAESDIAVAAASVIAREMFLRSLKDMEKKYEVEFPKGASDKVREAGVALVRKSGPEILLETAKCHFKTTDVVLKEMKTDRKVLGPEGQAVSKPGRPWPKKKKAAPQT